MHLFADVALACVGHHLEFHVYITEAIDILQKIPFLDDTICTSLVIESQLESRIFSPSLMMKYST